MLTESTQQHILLHSRQRLVKIYYTWWTHDRAYRAHDRAYRAYRAYENK